MELNLTIPVPVSINQLYVNQFKYNPKTKRREPTGARILSKQGSTTKKLIQKAARNQMKNQKWDYEWTKENYLYIDLVFYFSRKGRDADNCLKLLQDSLQGIVYDNDSRILCRTQRILYDSETPRVDLHIHPVKYIGIFEDENKMAIFESACKTCNRYNRNCSILSKAKEGRMQNEIDMETLKCSKFKEKS